MSSHDDALHVVVAAPPPRRYRNRNWRNCSSFRIRQLQFQSEACCNQGIFLTRLDTQLILSDSAENRLMSHSFRERSSDMPQRIFVFLVILATLPLSAQVEQATILGTITDSSGDVVPGASVTVLNSGTGERRATLSDDRGNYQLPALNIGAYEVTVEKTGFR